MVYYKVWTLQSKLDLIRKFLRVQRRTTKYILYLRLFEGPWPIYFQTVLKYYVRVLPKI